MGKPWNKKRRKEPRPKPHRGPCFNADCKHNGGTIHHCITCEKLAADGKLEEHEVFRVQTCQWCNEAALKKIKRHALVAHPVNILRFTGALLAGRG